MNDILIRGFSELDVLCILGMLSGNYEYNVKVECFNWGVYFRFLR